jgi:hypothetical protein
MEDGDQIVAHIRLASPSPVVAETLEEGLVI